MLFEESKERIHKRVIKLLVKHAYEKGYADAKAYYTNQCFFCGYSGEYSIWACDDCLAKEENQWFKDTTNKWLEY